MRKKYFGTLILFFYSCIAFSQECPYDAVSEITVHNTPVSTTFDSAIDYSQDRFFNDLQEAEKNVVTISGKVTNFEGIAIDSAVVQILHSDFTTAYETYTDKDGNYNLKNIRKGKYAAMYVIRPKEYPRKDAVEEKDMRLEFWGWNIIADRDLIINPRYHKLELYGTTVFEEYGGRPELLVYFRPMSITKNIAYGKAVYLNKNVLEEEADLSVSTEYIDVEVYAGEEPLRVNSIQPFMNMRVMIKRLLVTYYKLTDLK